jgi:bifunctional non-homologous end joining protein LigD
VDAKLKFIRRRHDDEVDFYGDDLRQPPLNMRKANLARLLARRPDDVHAAPFEHGEIGPIYFGMPA